MISPRMIASLVILALVLALGGFVVWKLKENQDLKIELEAAQQQIKDQDQKIDRLKSIMEMTDNLNQANNSIRDLGRETQADLRNANGYSTPVPDDILRILERVR